MEDIIDLIKSRRTVRKYEPKMVEWEYVSRVLDAGRYAPSSGNLQNWKFVVIIDPEERQKISECCLQQYWMNESPVHIVICAEPEKAKRYYGLRGERLYTVQNCAAAATSMMLEAHALGLGTCWVGAFDENMLKRTINAEESVRPQLVLTLGYPAEEPTAPPKYPLEAVTYLEKWRNKIKDVQKYFRNYSVVIPREIKKAKEKIKQTAQKVKEKIKKE